MGSIISQPRVTVNIVSAVTDVDNTEQKVLYVLQKLPAGTAVAGALNESLPIDKATIDGLAGQASHGAIAVNAGRIRNKEVQFDAIFLDDGAGATSATAIITFIGTATAAGSITVNIGSRVNGIFIIPVALGDDGTDIADALEALVAADLDAPFTAANIAGVLTITAKNGGTVANEFGIEFVGEVAGIATAISAWSGGLIDPDLSNVLDIIGNKRYQTIVWPWTTSANIEILKDFLDARFNVTNDIQDGVGIVALNDTKANLESLGNSENSQSLVLIGDLNVDDDDFKGPAILELSFVKASYVAAIRSLRLTDGASIADLVISRNGSRDSFGGAALASKPYMNTPLNLLPLVDTTRGFSDLEIEDLFDAGVIVIGNNPANNAVILGETVTTYKTDAAANPDISFKFLNFVDTSSQAREYFSNNLRGRFAQSRLTEGDLAKGRDMANAELIAAFCTTLYQDLASPDFVLLQSGEDALRFFKANLEVLIDLDVGRATITMIVPLVTQLREILATMQISFGTNG